jgi:predicted AlkP superfamily pyrophosphatase or phosphodiesterase
MKRAALVLCLLACNAERRPGTRHVLFVGIDGARPDAVQKANAPNLKRLAAEGARSFAATTQMDADTKSGPGWASVLTGVEPRKHLVDTNDDLHERAYPTFLARAHEAGYRGALAAGWIGIVRLTEQHARGWSLWSSDEVVTRRMVDTIARDAPGVCVVHLDDVDHEGHTTGFSADNPAYLAQIELADRRVGDLVAAVRARPATEEWLIVVTTDHGGEGTSHGARDAANRTVWIIVNGPGVEARDIEGASQLDAHPTIVRWLGQDPDPSLDGRSILTR